MSKAWELENGVSQVIYYQKRNVVSGCFSIIINHAASLRINDLNRGYFLNAVNLLLFKTIVVNIGMTVRINGLRPPYFIQNGHGDTFR